MRPPQRDRSPDLADQLRGLGAALIVLPVALRALVLTEPLPGWDLEPAIMPYTPAGLAPGTTALLSLSMMLGSTLLMACARHWLFPVLGLLAAAGPMIHALLLYPGDAEQVRIAIDWSAALICAAAIAGSIQSNSRLHGWLGGMLIALALPLAAKGVLQLTHEHALTLADYRQNAEQFLLARGWEPGSPQALQFDRRIRQPEATGWFALANVFGTFVGAGAVALGTAAIKSVRNGGSRTQTALLTVGLIACVWATWASGSKGSWAAAALAGLVLGAASLFKGTVSRRALGAALIGVPLAAIALRGALGERLGELSLLFRWFYLQGTTRVFGESLPWGPGPAGFKNQYAMLKPAIAPEDVTSPHSVLFDYLGTLGLLAIPAVVLILLISLSLLPKQRETTEEPEALTPEQKKPWLTAIIVIALVTTALSIRIETALLTPPLLATRIFGLAGWIAVAWTLFQLRASMHWIAPAAAAVVLAQSQIEMTPTQPASAGLAFALLGVACVQAKPARSVKMLRVGLTLFAAGITALTAIGPTINLMSWQSKLREAAAVYDPNSSEQTRRREELIQLYAQAAEPERSNLEAELLNSEILLAEEAFGILSLAHDEFPDDLRTARAMTTLLLTPTRAPNADTESAGTREGIRLALGLAEEMVTRREDSSTAWVLLARIRSLALAYQLPEVTTQQAREAIARVVSLDPLSPGPRVQAAEFEIRAGNPADAAAHARIAIELSEARRLDPLTQLDDRTLRRMRRLANP